MINRKAYFDINSIKAYFDINNDLKFWDHFHV